LQRIPKFPAQVIEPLEPLQVYGQPVFSLWLKPTNKIRFYVAANTESEFIAGFVSGDTSRRDADCRRAREDRFSIPDPVCPMCNIPILWESGVREIAIDPK
jgi:hypothetical protein